MDEQTETALAEAVQNLRIKWVVRQKVRTVEKAWLVDVFDSDHEHLPAPSKTNTEFRCEHPVGAQRCTSVGRRAADALLRGRRWKPANYMDGT